MLEGPESGQEVSRDSVMESMIALSMSILLFLNSNSLFLTLTILILERKYCNCVRITLQDEDELSGGDTFQ